MSDGTCAGRNACFCPASATASKGPLSSHYLSSSPAGTVMTLCSGDSTHCHVSLPQNSWRTRTSPSCLPKLLFCGPTHITFTQWHPRKKEIHAFNSYSPRPKFMLMSVVLRYHRGGHHVVFWAGLKPAGFPPRSGYRIQGFAHALPLKTSKPHERPFVASRTVILKADYAVCTSRAPPSVEEFCLNKGLFISLLFIPHHNMRRKNSTAQVDFKFSSYS